MALQYGKCALHAEQVRLQIHRLCNTVFHSNGYANAQGYVRTYIGS